MLCFSSSDARGAQTDWLMGKADLRDKAPASPAPSEDSPAKAATAALIGGGADGGGSGGEGSSSTENKPDRSIQAIAMRTMFCTPFCSFWNLAKQGQAVPGQS